MAKVNFKNCKFITSSLNLAGRPIDQKKEVVFLGKSNVGKSTLINSLVSQKIAFSSKKAGKTQLLNYFLIDNRFYLVDSPGYGYTSYGNKKDELFSQMMETYFVNHPLLAGAVLLIDSRRGIYEEEENMIHYLLGLGIKLILIYTKCDTIGQKEMALAKKEAEIFPSLAVFYSGKNADFSSLRSLIVKTFSI